MDHRLSLVAVSLVAIAVGVVVARPPPRPDSQSGPSTTASLVKPLLTVHVSGSVLEPGLVNVAEGSRVADAIAAAGGAGPSADLSGLNLAHAVTDGDQLFVPTRSRGAPPAPSADAGDGRISINRASASELEQLPGVGPVLAQRIVDYRDQIGGFETAEDLLDVPGIGERILAGLRDLIVVP